MRIYTPLVAAYVFALVGAAPTPGEEKTAAPAVVVEKPAVVVNAVAPPKAPEVKAAPPPKPVAANPIADKPVDKPGPPANKAAAAADKPAAKPAAAKAPPPAPPAPPGPVKPKAKEAPAAPAPVPPVVKHQDLPAAAAAPALEIADIVEAAAQHPLSIPVRWISSFPDEIYEGTELELQWTGGDVEYGFEVYYIPRWPRQRNYDLITIEPNTTKRSMHWTVPAISEYPKHTTFIFGVKDGSLGPGGNWYDLTAPLPFVAIEVEEEEEVVAEGVEEVEEKGKDDVNKEEAKVEAKEVKSAT